MVASDAPTTLSKGYLYGPQTPRIILSVGTWRPTVYGRGPLSLTVTRPCGSRDRVSAVDGDVSKNTITVNSSAVASPVDLDRPFVDPGDPKRRGLGEGPGVSAGRPRVSSERSSRPPSPPLCDPRRHPRRFPSPLVNRRGPEVISFKVGGDFKVGKIFTLESSVLPTMLT